MSTAAPESTASARPGAPPLASPPAARRLRVRTPELVELGFELADLGSRFVALLIDASLLLGAGMALLLIGLWAGPRLGFTTGLGALGAAVLLLLIFLVLWGYFVYFEGYHNGRTPGKRWTGIRVIHEGSQPLTLRGAAIRNLLRLVDGQPAFTFLLGGVVMWLHPRTQRLGDLAAGTLVIRDRGAAELSPEELAALVRDSREGPRIPDAAFDALERFIERRGELAPAARSRLAEQLGEALAEPLQWPEVGRDGLEDRLAALYRLERERRGISRVLGSAASPLARGLVLAQAPKWVEYRRLLVRADRRGLPALTTEELERFAVLYRTAAADLARARTYGAAGPLIFSLERWVGAGHNLLYRPTGRSWSALVAWLRHGFPALVRARWGFVAAAAGFLFLPALFSYGAIRAQPALARELMPHEMIVRAETAQERAEAGGGYVDVPEVFMPLMSSAIIANNVQVTFAAFAGGILAGLGTVLVLVFNGVNIGAVVGLFTNYGAAELLWAFVVPHGVVELTAACIAGAAGLLMGSALVAPGRLRRMDALTLRAREAVSLLAGTTLLLVLAGLIEGFISPARIPVTAKLAIAIAVAAAAFAYLLLAGRGESQRGGTVSEDAGRGESRVEGAGRGGDAPPAAGSGPITAGRGT